MKEQNNGSILRSAPDDCWGVVREHPKASEPKPVLPDLMLRGNEENIEHRPARSGSEHLQTLRPTGDQLRAAVRLLPGSEALELSWAS